MCRVMEPTNQGHGVKPAANSTQTASFFVESSACRRRRGDKCAVEVQRAPRERDIIKVLKLIAEYFLMKYKNRVDAHSVQ